MEDDEQPQSPIAPPSAPAGPVSGPLDRLEVARVSRLSPAIRSAFTPVLTVVVVFAALLFSPDPTGTTAWLGTWIAASAISVLALTRIAGRTVTPQYTRRMLTMMAGLVGTVWGAIPLVIRPEEPRWWAVQALWIVVGQGLAAIAARADRSTFLAAAAPLTVLSAAAVAVRGDSFALTLAALIVLGGASAWFTFATLHRMVVASIEQQFRADGLEQSVQTHRSQLSKATDSLNELATTDTLTGLPNREGFIASLVDHSRRVVTDGWLGIIDLDGFEAINESYGHHVGDEVLITAAKRWRRVLGSTLIGRTGGDEFVFIMSTHSDAEMVGHMLVEQLDIPVQSKNDGLIRLNCSVGIGRFHQGEPLSEVMARADRALYSAKIQGGGGVSVDGTPQPQH